MKKVLKLEDLDCAVCASKMEEGVKKIEGVKSCSVSFIAQKMTFEADDDKINEIIENIIKVCKKIEPDCVIVR